MPVGISIRINLTGESLIAQWVDENQEILSYVASLLENIKKFVPVRLLETYFGKWILDWDKIMRFLSLRQVMARGADSEATHSRVCIETWYNVGDALGIRARIKVARDLRLSCSYSRCPDPISLGGASRVCSLCGVNAYCSQRCQNQ